MGEKVTVKILLNDNGFQSFKPDDQLTQSLSFESGFPACGRVERLLDIVFAQLNTPNPTAEWALTYYNRSVSVGDVIVVGESAYAVEPIGFRSVTLTEDQVWYPISKNLKVVSSERDN